MNTPEIEQTYARGSSISSPARLWLTAYNSSGTIVARETHPEYSLHGAWIELIDEPASREELGVTRIEIELREFDGVVRSAWSMNYDADGKLTEAYETTVAARSAALLAEQLVRRLRWLVGPGSESVSAKSATMIL